jgi:hypothetical protein
MVKMSKAQARKRIKECWAKLRLVYMGRFSQEYPLSAKDMEAIQRIFKRAENKLK